MKLGMLGKVCVAVMSMVIALSFFAIWRAQAQSDNVREQIIRLMDSKPEQVMDALARTINDELAPAARDAFRAKFRKNLKLDIYAADESSEDIKRFERFNDLGKSLLADPDAFIIWVRANTEFKTVEPETP